jgi:arylsulfatase A-like enzyme
MPRCADLRPALRASNRFIAACAAMLGTAALLACSPASEDVPTAPPNLLLVTVDTLRPDELACYGGEAHIGETLCSLADGGTRFEWAFSTAPYTAPSIATVLTGIYPFAHGVRQSAVSFLHSDIETLPELLQQAGYTTAAFVSNPVLDRARRFDQGFGVYDQKMNREERNRPGFSERDARSATDAALAWAQVVAKPPWFLWVHYQDPHGPYDPPDASIAGDRHDAGDGRRLTVLPPRNNSGDGGIPHYQALPGLFTLEAYRERYRDEIRYLDGNLKRLIEGVDALGDAPLVLLTSDHGEAFGEDDYFFAHGHSVAIDQIRVPLLVRPSRADATAEALVNDTPVSLVDVAPTLAHAAGLDVPSHWPGRPLPVAGLAPTEPPRERSLFSEHRNRVAVVSGKRYFARDRRTAIAEARDPNSGGRVRLLPARTANLDDAGATPRYSAAEPDDADAALEASLSGFLLRAQRSRAGATHDSVPEKMKERLRALGYSE